MKMQWKKIWVKAAFWLVTEIILNLSGFDNLADYSEFLFEKEVAIAAHPPHMTAMVSCDRHQFNYNLPYRFTFALSA